MVLGVFGKMKCATESSSKFLTAGNIGVSAVRTERKMVYWHSYNDELISRWKRVGYIRFPILAVSHHANAQNGTH